MNIKNKNHAQLLKMDTETETNKNDLPCFLDFIITINASSLKVGT